MTSTEEIREFLDNLCPFQGEGDLVESLEKEGWDCQCDGANWESVYYNCYHINKDFSIQINADPYLHTLSIYVSRDGETLFRRHYKGYYELEEESED